MDDAMTPDRDLLDMTADIVAAYVTHNKIDAAALPAMITSIHAALGSAGSEAVEEIEPVQRLTAAQARKLITPGGIISLITQKPFKSMKRHLAIHGHTPESYREAFGLPADFPMVHPDYAKARSDLAKAMGLGAGGRQAAKPALKGKPGRKPKAS
ncbi:MucR family transcriptional regulator [Brevundimonas sp.]|uniref:MucR family transcriptional regulator n=1 Tax=Brevundimonas sp. TaxID=1871086 RepID=UPI003D6D856E